MNLHLRPAAFGAALILGLPVAGFAQAPPPPPPPQQFAPADPRALSAELAQQVRQLGQEIEDVLQGVPNGGHLVQDARELSQTIDEFREAMDDPRDRNRPRQAFAAFDASWDHLKGELGQLGVNAPGVTRSTRGVEQVGSQLREAMGLNPPPPNFRAAAAPPEGVDDLRRLAHALVSRAEALEAYVPNLMADHPDVQAITKDTTELSRAADRFHDTLDAGQGIEALQAAYGPVRTLSDRLAPVLSQAPSDLKRAWKGYAYADATIRQQIGLAVPEHAPPDFLRAPAPAVAQVAAPAVSPIVPLADQLVAQLDEFLEAYAPTARVVPEGIQGLDDATRLRAAAVEFQQAAAQGLAPNQLAFAYRNVDAYWQRLGRRVQRIARGRTGPNIQRVWNIGQTCEQLHQMLAMPGTTLTFPAPADPNGGF